MIRIGFLVDGLIFKKWQYEIFKHIESQPNLKLEVIIVRASPSSFTSNGSFFYRASQALDRKFFSVKNDIFSNVDIKKYAYDTSVIRIDGKEKRYSYQFPNDKIEEIKALKLDVLIRFGFGILKGDILNAAQYGVWSLHHGDNLINRGGPPAFWEVVNRESVTGITLQRLSEDLDGGQVIKKSYIKTDNTSFYRNKNQAFWAGVELFNLALDEVEKGNLTLPDEGGNPFIGIYSHPLYRDPGNMSSLKIMIKFWLRRIKEGFTERMNSPQWYLLYKFRDDEKIEKSIFRFKGLYPPKGFDWADPFIIRKNGKFFLFFEELEIRFGKGHISLLEFNDKGVLSSTGPKKVIEERYHLSYPYVFSYNEQFYMLPESADAAELWLYECEEFPEKWKKKHQIFSNKSIYDASLILHEDYWYLFGTEILSEGGSRDQYLHIYYSNSLTGAEWHSHPMNPITQDVRGARPAGKIFREEGKIFRPGQIGAPKYGYGIQFYEILELSPTGFKEVRIDRMLPKWNDELQACHTFNTESGFSVVDAQAPLGKIRS